MKNLTFKLFLLVLVFTLVGFGCARKSEPDSVQLQTEEVQEVVPETPPVNTAVETPATEAPVQQIMPFGQITSAGEATPIDEASSVDETLLADLRAQVDNCENRGNMECVKELLRDQDCSALGDINDDEEGLVVICFFFNPDQMEKDTDCMVQPEAIASACLLANPDRHVFACDVEGISDSLKEHCYMHNAAATGDAVWCIGIRWEADIADCFGVVAAYHQDPSICFSPNRTKKEWGRCLMTMAGRSENPLLCDAFKTLPQYAETETYYTRYYSGSFLETCHAKVESYLQYLRFLKELYSP